MNERSLRLLTSLFRRIGWAYLVIFGGFWVDRMIDHVLRPAAPKLPGLDAIQSGIGSFPLIGALALAPLAQWAWNMRGIRPTAPGTKADPAAFGVVTAVVLCGGFPMLASWPIDRLSAALGRPQAADPAFEAVMTLFGIGLMLAAPVLTRRLS